MTVLGVVQTPAESRTKWRVICEFPESPWRVAYLGGWRS